MASLIRKTFLIGTTALLPACSNGDTSAESTATTSAMRVWPQVATIPMSSQFWMDVDSGQVLQYTVAPSSATGTGLDLKIDVAGYQERV